jgi:hypothetical protein
MYPKYKHAKITTPTNHITTSYPFFNTMSILMVIMRVYPRLAEYVKANNV